MQFTKHYDVVVIGGGPGGSMTAALLAREGLRVALFEKDRFPRYHIGESLLTSIIPVLRFAGLYDRINDHGFVRKYRAFFRIIQGARAARLEFSRQTRNAEDNDYTWQVVRSEFDKLLLDYAGECGAEIHEETCVDEIYFEGALPVGVLIRTSDGESTRIGARFLVDASGQNGVMATRYLKNRQYEEYFANVAIGNYWKDFNPYVDDDGNAQVGAFAMEAIPDCSGWIWAIPLHDGTLSVGAVVHRDTFAALKKRLKTTEDVYADILARCPDTSRLLAGASPTAAVRTWKDYSYASESFAGPGYRLVGDAAAFIDPFFSSGVHLAVYGALSAAASICASVRGDVDEARAASFHSGCVRSSYVRFAVIVAGVYRQIRNQGEVVLRGVSDADIQPAFQAISPVVTGRFDFFAGEAGDTTSALSSVLAYVKELVHDMQNPEASSPIGKVLGQTMLGDKDAMVMQGLASYDGLAVLMEQGNLTLRPTEPAERAPTQ